MARHNLDHDYYVTQMAEPLAATEVTDPFHKLAIVLSHVELDDAPVRLFRVGGPAERPEAAECPTVGGLPADLHPLAQVTRNMSWLADQFAAAVDDLGGAQPFWGLAAVSAMWGLSDEHMADYYDFYDKRPGRERMPVEHHPDRIREIHVTIMFHDHGMIMVSHNGQRPPMLMQFARPGVERFTADSDMIAEMLRAVDAAAGFEQRMGRTLPTIAEG